MEKGAQEQGQRAEEREDEYRTSPPLMTVIYMYAYM